jgi:uncharacterized protein YlxP (DUF503 family)
MPWFIATFSLYLPGCQSLKQKRSALAPLLSRLKRYNLSVVEAAHQDSWQTATLKVAKLGLNRAQLDRDLAEVVTLIENDFHDITLMEVKSEFYI